jgi:putative Mg2+ transporter-C (MgtC) family protein
MVQHLDLVVIVVRLGLSVVFAAVIGLERELAAQPAGLRTHILVALGAALFTLVGTEVAGTDPTRIAAQVVSGVGFLGAGAILREGPTVRGLTTAATLWAAAAIGLANGLGAYRSAGIAVILTLLATVGLKAIEKGFLPRRRGQLVALDVEHDALPAVVPAVCAKLPPSQVVSVTTSVNGRHHIELRARPAPSDELPELAAKLLAVDGVVGVEINK